MSEATYICFSCDQPKYSLEPRKSKVTGMNILLCKTCIENGYEPRQLLVIAYYSGDKMREKAIRYIKGNLYVGETITLTEVL
jgi:hypothetical protein